MVDEAVKKMFEKGKQGNILQKLEKPEEVEKRIKQFKKDMAFKQIMPFFRRANSGEKTLSPP